MSLCEDYPCCGHDLVNDPCERQWYDAPDAFDTTKNPHALCDHENGDCDVEYYDEDVQECDYCGSEDHRTDRCPDVYDDRYHGPYEDAAMEFGLFGSET